MSSNTRSISRKLSALLFIVAASHAAEPLSVCELVAQRATLIGKTVTVRGAWVGHEEGSWLNPIKEECYLGGQPIDLLMGGTKDAPRKPTPPVESTDPKKARREAFNARLTMAFVATFTGTLDYERPLGDGKPGNRILRLSDCGLQFTYSTYSDADWVKWSDLLQRPMPRRTIN